MLHDAHFHCQDPAFLKQLRKYGISGIVNIQSPQEYAFIKGQLSAKDAIRMSAGIHPWDVESITWEAMRPIMEEVTIIGEIGLDNVWCQSDIQKQKAVFERSLAYACKHHKPVILHTKGMEKQVLSYIKKYRNTYLVHWYSSMDNLKDYVDYGCYFTIGPSIKSDAAVMQVAKLVPLDHLMIESDGLNALSWCEGRTVTLQEYKGLLQRTIREIAQIKQMEMETVEQQLNHTFEQFIHLAMIADSGMEDGKNAE